MCEGEDATQLIIHFLEYLRKREKRFEDYIVFDFGGNDELSGFLSDIRLLPGFDIVKSITIVRDSEVDHNKAIQSVKSALGKHGFPVPPKPNTIERGDGLKVAYSLFPSLSENSLRGTLEDLFIDNLSEDEVDNLLFDINAFLNDLKSKGRNFTWFHKTKLHTYFSVTDKFVKMKTGQAAQAGAFNFECAEMNSLKELLENIATK